MHDFVRKPNVTVIRVTSRRLLNYTGSDPMVAMLDNKLHAEGTESRYICHGFAARGAQPPDDQARLKAWAFMAYA